MNADVVGEGARGAERRVLIGAIVATGVGVAALAALGRYAFIWKTAVIPVLLVAALLSRRLGRFLDDWGVFLALVVLFDFLRGLVFAVITHWQLPVYMQYVISAERWLLGGRVMPTVLQDWRAQLGWGESLDRILTVVHGSHFAFFLLFGLAVWMLRPQHFRRYAIAVVVLIYVGALLYLIVPTVPPWMAAEFGVVPPITHVSARIYNTELPVLQEAFDVNPIAAMPSLHAALPTLCGLTAAELFGWAALPVAAYVGLVYVAIMYLGEHYFVDVLAGVLLAVAVFAALRLRLPLRRPSWVGSLGIRPVLLTALLIVAAEGLGQLTVTLRRPFDVTPAFTARELTGRTPLAHLFLGRFAYDRGDLPRARQEFEYAAAHLDVPVQRQTAQRWLARTAFRQGDYDAVIAEVAPLRGEADPRSLVLLARAYLQDGHGENGEGLLRELVARYPRDPEPLYWLTRRSYEQRRFSAADARTTAARLRMLDCDDSDGQWYCASLLALASQ